MNAELYDEIIKALKYYLESKANTYVNIALIIKWLSKNNKKTDITIKGINLAIKNFISELGDKSDLCYSNQLFYYKDVKEGEDEIINYIEILPNLPAVGVVSRDTIDDVISQIEIKKKIQFSFLQKAAVSAACNNRFSIVTGGPGTGKTTIIEAIASVWVKYAEIRVWAPTGKASQRIGEATGFYACTIHQGLKEVGMVGGLLIIDEVSMIDAYLMGQILKYNRNNNIVLIGDADQIPSIAAGDVLFDLLHVKNVMVTRLAQGFRSDNTIIKNSIRILDKTKLIDLDYDKSFIFFTQKQKPLGIDLDESEERKLRKIKAEKVLQEVYKLWNYLLKQCHDIKDVMILLPLRKEDEETGKHVTTDTINRYIQKNRYYREQIEKAGKYFINDRVIYNKNRHDIKPLNKNAEEELYNGMLGTVTKIDKNGWLNVEFDNGAIFNLASNDENISLAYAITVYKAQGSEFKHVLFVSADTKFCDRNLFYTAITRAKEQVVIVGRFDLFTWLLLNMEGRRNTFLKKHFKIITDSEKFLKYKDEYKWRDECVIRDKNIVQFLNKKTWVSNAKNCIVKSKAMVRAEYNMYLDIYDMRLISMYFAKIKVCDITTRRVTIAKADFVKYFGKKIESKYWTKLPEKHQQLFINIDGIDYEKTENPTDLWPYKKVNRNGKSGHKFWKEIQLDNGKIVCNISDELLRHTFGIEEGIGYINYNIAYLSMLTSDQIRFYEYARQYLYNKKEMFTVTIDKLQKILHLEGKYETTDDLKKCVKRICNAINKCTDINVEVKYYKQRGKNNRTYHKCSFTVTYDPPKECRQIINEDESTVIPRYTKKGENKLIGKESRKQVRTWKTVIRPYTETEVLRLVELGYKDKI